MKEKYCGIISSSIVKIYYLDWITKKKLNSQWLSRIWGDIEDVEKKKGGDSEKSTKCGKSKTHKMRRR